MASTIKVDNVQNQPGTNIIDKCGTTITLGQSGDTIALACGASQTGFGRTGTVDWITTPKVTGDSPITGVTGKGYFLNTTGGTITLNLPAGAAGSIVSMADYARTWNSNKVTVTPNGSEKIGGTNASATLSTEGQSVTFVYVDSTQGWLNIQDSTSNVVGAAFIAATVSGACNTLVTSGDYKTAIFKGPGTFCVSAGSGPLATGDYLVVAGGGATRSTPDGANAGGGAGGFRLSNSVGGIPAPTTSPLANPTGLTLSVQGYPITVGGGGSNPSTIPAGTQAPNGNLSTFDSITSAGGGGAGHTGPGSAGGSGGGGSQGPTPTSGYPGGAGDTPATPIAQGFPGGAGYDGLSTTNNGGGGGGAAVAGANAACATGGNGGAGSFIACAMIGPTAPSYGTPGPATGRYFAGGGGGSTCGPGTAGNGGAGGGGDSSHPGAGCNGTINTGGGSGGGGPTGGGSGIVMIRYKFQ
jgi:hypothetical protein